MKRGMKVNRWEGWVFGGAGGGLEGCRFTIPPCNNGLNLLELYRL
jgi:hypothetical protein